MPITIFTKSVGGYNKQQVDEYISNMNRAYVKSKHDNEKKIETLEAEIAKLKAELAEAEAAAAAAPVELPAEVVTEAEPAPQTASTVSIDDDIAKKSRRYDEISMKVGEILMNANAEAAIKAREADEILANANAEAEIKAREADEILTNANAEAAIKVREADETLANANAEAATKAREADEILANANAEAEIKAREADEKVKRILNDTMSTLRGDFTSFIAKLTELLETSETELTESDLEQKDGTDE